ncbi:hypothetical protein EPN96_04000 [bacterium]|nr:MAG: hypothetical protein EPN96_04000 [bacterium]
MENNSIEIIPKDAAGSIEEATARFSGEEVARRILERDHTLWSDSPEEICDRLGWLEVAENSQNALEDLRAFREELIKDKFGRVLLLGMGGSSLAPELFAKVFPSGGGVALSVLDSVLPDEILKKEREHDPAETLYVVSSKSGTTVEVDTLMKYFYSKAVEKLGASEAGKHFIAITNPGTALVRTAESLSFRKTFFYRPDIGGRYAALSPVGVIPAALIGMDLQKLLASAVREAKASREKGLSAGAKLGIALGALALRGRDKLTLLTGEKIAPFLDWLEQLVAESTGKDGKGIVPVIGEALKPPSLYSSDRVFARILLPGEMLYEKELKALAAAGHPVITIRLEDVYELGGQFFLWEYATAVACWLLEVHPFNQPDVEAAKKFAREVLAEYKIRGRSDEGEVALRDSLAEVYGETTGTDAIGAVKNFAKAAEEGGYIAVQAYLLRRGEVEKSLAGFREALSRWSGVPVTLGYGPRFLHSTGQLHKGGPKGGIFIQICAKDGEDIEIPGEGVTFGTLRTAQYLGDFQALKKSGKKVLRLKLRGDAAETIERLSRG